MRWRRLPPWLPKSIQIIYKGGGEGRGGGSCLVKNFWITFPDPIDCNTANPISLLAFKPHPSSFLLITSRHFMCLSCLYFIPSCSRVAGGGSCDLHLHQHRPSYLPRALIYSKEIQPCFLCIASRLSSLVISLPLSVLLSHLLPPLIKSPCAIIPVSVSSLCSAACGVPPLPFGPVRIR